MEQKSKAVTILLNFFFGIWGIHRFYLGQTGKGILYILLSFTGISFIIAIIDLIGFVSMSQRTFDWKYNPHRFGRSAASQRFYNTYGNLQNNPHNYQNANKRPDFNNSNYDKSVPSEPNRNQAQHYDAKQVIQKVAYLREEIIEKIKKSNNFDNDIVRDIKPMVDNYLKQVKELVERQERLSKTLEKNPLSKFDVAISQLKQKATETANNTLKYEYQNAVSKLEKQKETIQDFSDQLEMIDLRLDSTIMSLEQIKFDLIRIENLTTDEQRKEFSRLFEEKSTELNDYLSALKDSYNA